MGESIYKAYTGKLDKQEIRLTVYYDDNPENPRTWDNLGKMIGWRSRNYVGDKHDYKTSREFLEHLAWQFVSEEETFNIIKENYTNAQLVKYIEQYAVMLPVYLYEHGGIKYSTAPFNCRWDSGQVGWIYVSFEDLRAELPDLCGQSEQILRETAWPFLIDEVETYSYYVNGDVYGYKLEKIHRCKECGTEHFEEICSNWGFYGPDLEKNGLFSSIDREYRGALNLYFRKKLLNLE